MKMKKWKYMKKQIKHWEKKLNCYVDCNFEWVNYKQFAQIWQEIYNVVGIIATGVIEKRCLSCGWFYFFCGGRCDNDYNAIIDDNLKNRFCIAVCIALLRE